MRRKAIAFIAVLVLVGVAGGTYVALGQSGTGGNGSDAPGEDVLNPPSTATSAATGGSTSTGGHGPPIPQHRELPDDRTGGATWVETTAAGATWRFPADDREWELAWDQGSYYSGFAGIPNIRVTHLTTGQARVYSLLTGEVMLCADRSAVLGNPGDQGEAVECAGQDLTPQERQVFAHVRVTGRYEYYHGPPPYPVPTVPGLKMTPVPPEWEWTPPGLTPEAPSATPEATPTKGITPTPQSEPGGPDEH
jgi:hypothetical protein